jgi:hypothetical protein
MHRAAARVMTVLAVAAFAVAVLSCGSTNEGTSFGSASGGFGGGSSGGSGVTCTTSAACLPGEVCCEPAGTGASASCHAGPCSVDMIQLCGMSAECLQAGYVCSTTTQTPIGNAMVCGPAEDGGTDAQASLGDGSDGPSPGDAPVSDGASPGDAPVSDGASPGDVGPQSDGASDGDAGTSDVVEAGSSGG